MCLLLAGALGAVLLTRGGGETPPAPVAKVETPPAPPPQAPVQAAAEPEAQVVGPAQGDGRRPLYGTAVVMGPKAKLASLNLLGLTLPEGGTLFASFTPEERPRTTRRQPGRNTATPAAATAAPEAPATPEPTPAVAAAPEPTPLKGRTTIGGFGPAKGLTLYNQENRHWTKCEPRLPSNKRDLSLR